MLTDNLIEKWVLLSVKKLRQRNLPQDVVLVGVASSRKREVCETFLVKKEFKNVVDAVVNAKEEAGAIILVRSVQVRM